MAKLPEYELIYSDRRTIAIQITTDGRLQVRCPRGLCRREAEAFLEEKRIWIQKHLAIQASIPQEEPFTQVQLREFGERTRSMLNARLPEFAKALGVFYGKVTVRSQHTRWGSCSSRGNLSFNCLLALVPDGVFDYVLLHELCHLKQMNHSPDFWTEVRQYMPDYETHRAWLKEHGAGLIRRLP